MDSHRFGVFFFFIATLILFGSLRISEAHMSDVVVVAAAPMEIMSGCPFHIYFFGFCKYV